MCQHRYAGHTVHSLCSPLSHGTTDGCLIWQVSGLRREAVQAVGPWTTCSRAAGGRPPGSWPAVHKGALFASSRCRHLGLASRPGMPLSRSALSSETSSLSAEPAVQQPSSPACHHSRSASTSAHPARTHLSGYQAAQPASFCVRPHVHMYCCPANSRLTAHGAQALEPCTYTGTLRSNLLH